ncbi:MAG: hypothetical protein WC373_09345 [Smithella sp.]
MDAVVNDDNAANSSIAGNESSPDFVAPAAQEDNANGDQNADDKSANGADANANADADKGGEGDKGKNLEDRFDKDPRFKEVIDQKNAATQRAVKAEAQVATIKAASIGEVQVQPLPEGIVDPSTKTPDELREWMEDDPVGYQKNLIEFAKHAVKSELTGDSVRTATMSAIEKTFDDYGKDNPDFVTMWDSGDIPKFMEAHPGHNAISAHMALTGDKRFETKVAAAVKEAEERVIKNFQAKKNATVITPAAQARADKGVDTELKDTQQAGGAVSVLAKRLADMRRASVT